MKLHQRTVAMAAALGFLLTPVAFAQTPAPAAPAAPAAPRKLISPFRGDATVEFTQGGLEARRCEHRHDHDDQERLARPAGGFSGWRRAGPTRPATSPAATSIAIRGRSCPVEVINVSIDDAVQHADAEQQLPTSSTPTAT
jgi:hypothetical protein